MRGGGLLQVNCKPDHRLIDFHHPFRHLASRLQTFATPKKHHKAKPFFDHVLSFTIADNRDWVRNYQVSQSVSPGRRRRRACSYKLKTN